MAIHRLNGEFLKTWTSEKSSTMWLRDMLPKKFPNARIMIFGYNADVFGNLSIAGVRDVARKLLGSIRDVKEDDVVKGKPIVLIGHSLGGIIIKQASFTNHLSTSPISSLTSRLVLKAFCSLALPTGGANGAKWMGLISGIAAIALGKPKSVFIDTLKTNSEALIDISEDFRSIAERFAIVSFFEEDAYPILGGVIVEKHSAIMELAHEEVMMLGGNHQTMCRFTDDDDDERFDPVWRRIRRAEKGPNKSS